VQQPLAHFFSAPIAAAIFAHEMLLRRVRTSESAPVLMAALGGYFSAVMLLGDNRRFLNVVGDPLPFSPFALGIAVAVGICCGLVSTLVHLLSYFWSRMG
jgi:H+/Cl- antiporter ClcA